MSLLLLAEEEESLLVVLAEEEGVAAVASVTLALLPKVVLLLSLVGGSAECNCVEVVVSLPWSEEARSATLALNSLQMSAFLLDSPESFSLTAEVGSAALALAPLVAEATGVAEVAGVESVVEGALLPDEVEEVVAEAAAAAVAADTPSSM